MLTPVAIAWIVGGWFIFSKKNDLLAWLANATSRPPAVGTQNPKKAAEYVEKALKRSAGIRLDLMEKACTRLPLKYRGEQSLYEAHWLERYKNWNLHHGQGTPAPDEIVEPDEYWGENRKDVVQSLKDLIDASVYSFEIPQEKGEPIVVASLIQKHARAVCMEPIGLFAYGDYIEFLEATALAKILKEKKFFDIEYPSRDEQNLFVWQSLKKNQAYKDALIQFFGGGVPASHEMCSGRNFRLPCVSPPEALSVLSRRVYIAESSELPRLFLEVGRLHRFMGGESHLGKATDFLSGTLRDAGTEREGRLTLADVYLKMDDSKGAYDQIGQAQMLFKDKGLTDSEFRDLAKKILIRMGRSRDADCFSDLSELPSGVRDHCRQLNLN